MEISELCSPVQLFSGQQQAGSANEPAKVELEGLSVTELERHRKWLQGRILHATAAVNANQAIASLEDDFSTLSAAQVEAEISSTALRIAQLRQNIAEAKAQHALKEQILECVAMSKCSQSMVFPLPTATSTKDEASHSKAPAQPYTIDSIAKMYKSKEAGDVCMLVDEQFTLSTQLVQLEQKAQALEKELTDTALPMSDQQCEVRHQVAQILEEEKEAENTKAQDVDKADQELTAKINRYRLRIIMMQHILQSLIVGSGLESSELEAWRDVLLECGHVPKM